MMSAPSPLVSVVIPTHNRRDMLERVLDSLARQTLPPDSYEVIVVDDGSTDGTPEVANLAFPYRLRYVRQDNRGPAAARNNGANHAYGNMLLFLDDDIVASPDLVKEHIVTQLRYPSGVIVIGETKTVLPPAAGPFGRLAVSSNSPDGATLARYTNGEGRLPGTFCLSGNMSVQMEVFRLLGMFAEDLLGTASGWSRWEDVELGWRAEKSGIPIAYAPRAVGYHHDYAAANLQVSCRRMTAVSMTAPWLFKRHPDIQSRLPMFYDKHPINLGSDDLALIIRKLLRMMASSRPVVWGMEQVVRRLEAHFPKPWLLRPLYRWIIGAYIFRGYRQGLRRLRATTR